jgi:NAD dependent epimerase/dehydratase family enzyme
LGRKLAKRLEARATTITLSRGRSGGEQIAWQPDGSAARCRASRGVDAIVNLAGESIAGQRWTAARKRRCGQPHPVHAHAGARDRAMRAPPRSSSADRRSAITAARRRADHRIDAAGFGLSRAAVRRMGTGGAQVESPSTRWRSSAPVSRSIGRGGALGKMLLPFKLGLGATLGSGDQFMPWIHVDDWTAMVSWLIQNDRAGASSTPRRRRRSPIARSRARSAARCIDPPSFTHRHSCCARAGRDGVDARPRPARPARRCGAAWISFSHRTLEPALEASTLIEGLTS